MSLVATVLHAYVRQMHNCNIATMEYMSINVATMQSIDIFIFKARIKTLSPVMDLFLAYTGLLLATSCTLDPWPEIFISSWSDLELAAGKMRVLYTCACAGDELFSNRPFSHPCKSGVEVQNPHAQSITCSLDDDPKGIIHKLTACTCSST